MSTGRSKREDFDTTPLMLNFDQRVKPKPSSDKKRETKDMVCSVTDVLCCCIVKPNS